MVMERSEAGSVVPGTLWKSEAEWDTSFCWAIRFLQFEIRSTGAGRVDSIAGTAPRRLDGDAEGCGWRWYERRARTTPRPAG
jgi:hypothetical protein